MGQGKKPGKETTMKYTITMRRNEVKAMCNAFEALSKTTLKHILPINEDTSFAEYIDKLLTTSIGSMHNKNFRIEFTPHTDDLDVSVNMFTLDVEMSTTLFLKIVSFYKKYLEDVLPYIVAFAKKHEDEMNGLTEFLDSRAEAMTEALAELVEEFDLDELKDSAIGCFKEALNPTADTSADGSDDSFEDICKTTDEMLDDIVAKAIEAIDAASDKEAEMHRFGSAVASTLSDLDADDALYLTKQIFGRIIDHYEEQEKRSKTLKSMRSSSKREALERKYHNKNTEE